MFSLRTTLGCITIIIADLIICYTIFWLVLSVLPWTSEVPGYEILFEHLRYTVFTLIIFLSLSSTHFYSYIDFTYPFDLLKRTITAFLLSFTSIATMGFFIRNLTPISWRYLPPLCAAYACIFGFRFILFFCLSKNRERILLLGANKQARMIIDESKRKSFKGYEVIGVSTARELYDEIADIHGVPVLNVTDNFEESMRIYAVDRIIITKRDRRGNMPINELLKCKMKKIHVQEGFSFYERVKRMIYIDEFLKPSWFIFEEGFFHTSLHGSVKRLQGMAISFILLTILSPILILVAIIIKLESPGPVFFFQERVGRNGKTFRLIKFRSMCQDAEKNAGPMFAQKNDPRVTRFGKFIRKVRLDEIPQLINIFKGDMDMVGPRPERPVFVKELDKIVPYYNLRHSVRPGLTGWAQVNYSYGDSFEDSREKLKYDLYYVKHFSWYLDLLIMLLTIKEVLFGRGR